MTDVVPHPTGRPGQEDIDASKAPLLDHLVELRQRGGIYVARRDDTLVPTPGVDWMIEVLVMACGMMRSISACPRSRSVRRVAPRAAVERWISHWKKSGWR